MMLSRKFEFLYILRLIRCLYDLQQQPQLLKAKLHVGTGAKVLVQMI
jgi:hypothetical protein